MQKKDKIVVAGPCSAESYEQVMATAKALAEQGIKTFRAGVWKPRTRPGGFEGVGEAALEWLAEAKKTYGLRIATELNTARNAELLLKYGIDIAWIGTRTSTNPFDVQDIADALRGVDIDVYVKNPICPEGALWLGAIERIEAAVKGRIVAIHRGFSTLERDVFRNAPIWTIPLWLREQCPELPIVCDPSHIAGRADLVHQIAHMSVILGFDGIFMESHITPSCAMSDALQQLTPQEAGDMLRDLGLL